MKRIHSSTVIPALPPALERLRHLAYNLRWETRASWLTCDASGKVSTHVWLPVSLAIGIMLFIPFK